jgi:hypothetical protein
MAVFRSTGLLRFDQKWKTWRCLRRRLYRSRIEGSREHGFVVKATQKYLQKKRRESLDSLLHTKQQYYFIAYVTPTFAVKWLKSLART